MTLSIVRTYQSTQHGEGAWRLPAHHTQDIRDVARGVEESNAGIACRYLIDTLTSGSQADVDDDGYMNHLEAVERFCDRFGVWKHPVVANWRMRVTRCRRALDRMSRAGNTTDVAILHIAHGYPDPIITQHPELQALGELGGLVRYTAHVEAHRLELAKREGVQNPGDPPSVVRARERAAWANRAISSGDALRSALSVFGEAIPDEGHEPRHIYEGRVAARTARRKAHDGRRDAFVLECKLQAAQMLGDAEHSYHAAWLRSAV